ncbi:MAG TPA: hypothetical protein VH619_18170 [Verrucomicrobiae bacterium]|jgi:hypothetical protein|nr:hypothetical protein [Verrucomicrobiae bacterium]
MPANSREPRWHDGNESNGNPQVFVINTEEYERIPFGEGQDDPDMATCAECATPAGSIHKLGCSVEPCPRCGAPAVTCDCDYEGD